MCGDLDGFPEYLSLQETRHGSSALFAVEDSKFKVQPHQQRGRGLYQVARKMFFYGLMYCKRDHTMLYGPKCVANSEASLYSGLVLIVARSRIVT
jgi:hypothetical protein